MKSIISVLSLSIFFLIGCIALFYPDYELPRVVKFLITTQVLFILSLAIYYTSRRLDFDKRHKNIFFILIIIAISARIIIFVGSGDKFYHSDDVYRYIWDGKVNASGINPYVYAPPSPELEHLQDENIYPRINHPKVPTIYPPMAQNIFLIAYKIGGDSTLVFRLICALFELLTIFALFIWLKKRGIRKSNLLLYLFSPLVLVEFYMSAHLDILAMPFLIAAFLTLNDDRPVATGVMMALACLIKFLGLFFVPIIFLYFINKKRWTFLLAFITTIVLLYLPYIFGSNGLVLGSLFKYLNQWQFNGSIFNLLKYGLQFEYARYTVAILFILWIVYILISKSNINDKLFKAYAGHLVLTPTFFPWYFVWIFPLVLINLSPAFLYLSGAILLSYHVHIGYYATGEWTPIIWFGIAYYIPFFILLSWGPLKKILNKGTA